jgi:hypothetical protein
VIVDGDDDGAHGQWSYRYPKSRLLLCTWAGRLFVIPSPARRVIAPFCSRESLCSRSRLSLVLKDRYKYTINTAPLLPSFSSSSSSAPPPLHYYPPHSSQGLFIDLLDHRSICAKPPSFCTTRSDPQQYPNALLETKLQDIQQWLPEKESRPSST